ncbi:MAG: hypothetical protein V1708_03215 [Candidatus Micrarchaeota archaeon]
MGRVRNFLKAYHAAHQTRASWYHLQWRITAALFSAAAVALIYNFLFWRYNIFIPEIGGFLGERYFSWFMIGAIFGIVCLSAVFEGEFILGVRRVAKEVEHEAKSEFRRAPKRAKRKG